jgi:hypothetical protein
MTKPAPNVTIAQHKVNVQGTPPGTPQPTLGSHPKGGANASTVSKDTGTSYTGQQQQ